MPGVSNRYFSQQIRRQAQNRFRWEREYRVNFLIYLNKNFPIYNFKTKNC